MFLRAKGSSGFQCMHSIILVWRCGAFAVFRQRRMFIVRADKIPDDAVQAIHGEYDGNTDTKQQKTVSDGGIVVE